MAEGTTATMAKRIALGSGKVYLVEKPSDMTNIDTIIETYCNDDYEFAAVKNGATLTYTPTTYEAKDDLGRFSKTILTSESTTLACGFVTVDKDVLAKLVETGRVDTTTKGRQVVKIGGSGNANGKSYLIIFRNIDKADGDIYIIITGKNTAELSLAFSPESETILNPTFTAKPELDTDGTQVIIVFDKKTEAESEAA
ncbi:hypothetical protein [Faecalibaculum rodentium]|uniref:hypothetical protein n=1 Tax=Faecalibaculum rodentium TaxID=1702221 RepID=UPI00273016C1|nr:hypothetical protein [Faecalibaculum rodentium]